MFEPDYHESVGTQPTNDKHANANAFLSID